MTQRRPQTISGNIEILECASDENSGCVYGLFQRSFPVDQHHAQPTSREQPRALQPREASANNHYISCFHTSFAVGEVVTVGREFSYEAGCFHAQL
jgi:hypothetical protein